MVKARPLRADAERNRRLILEVAETVFAAEGLAVPIDEIARRAGLGVGTLYRHFPTKEALFAAIIVTRMDEATEHARAALAQGAPGEAFFGFLTNMVEGWRKKKDFMEALSSAGVDLKDVARSKHAFHAALAALLERAQDEGVVREDVAIGEILALISGMFLSLARHDISAEGRDRMLGIVLDGLRTTVPAPVSKAKPKPKKRAVR
jgi:AcrR family transcriptional regulator